MDLIKEDICGVYRIVNNINCKLYIGSSVHINKRFIEHKSALRRKNHYNSHLQKAWDKYGEENFDFEILEVIEDSKDILIEREQYWIDYYKSYDGALGYNISRYARGSGGYEVSEETREKIRQAALGRTVSDETKEKLSKQRLGELNQFYGRHHSEETKKIISEKAKKRDKSTMNMSGLELGRGTKYWAEETYKKLSEQHQGEKSSTSKLKEEDVIDILKMIQEKMPYSEIKKKYPIADSEISRIKHKKRWGYLYDKFPELYT